jgi:hypothetical protein
VRLTTLTAVVLCAALLAAGCGGGGSGGSNTTAPPKGGGTPKKATAPNAPAGSKVVACKESGSATEGLRATVVDCKTARATMIRWGHTEGCALARGASRGSCALGGFRCQAVRADRGVAVSCARPGGDVAFVATKASGSG